MTCNSETWNSSGLLEQKAENWPPLQQVMDNLSILPHLTSKKTKFTPHSALFANTLICGNNGMGKTTYAQALLKYANIYGVFLDCATLAGDRVDSAMAKLKSYVAEAMGNQPSILVLDNIDSICPVEQEESVPDPNVRVLSSAALDMIQYAQQKSNVCVLATCKAIEQTHKLVQSGNLFPNVLSLLVPSKTERGQILERLVAITSELEGYTISPETIHHMAAKTENFEPEDLHVCIL